MQPLNYCRQMVRQFTDTMTVPSFPEHNRRILTHIIDLVNASQKFLLPSGGRLYDDPEYRALDESVPLRLPYPFIALEYARPEGVSPVRNGDGLSSKAIVFARERDDGIVMTPVAWFNAMGIWSPMPELAIPKIGYLDRSMRSPLGVPIKTQRADLRIPLSDYSDEMGALLCFLNVLQCANVHVERHAPKRTNMKVKAALPFDSYHVLTVDVPSKNGGGTHTGGHRSPREHLRRGHIRRLVGDRRIWVNATVVAAGRGAGVVRKDYAFRCAA